MSLSRVDDSACYVNMFSRSCLLNEYCRSFRSYDRGGGGGGEGGFGEREIVTRERIEEKKLIDLTRSATTIHV